MLRTKDTAGSKTNKKIPGAFILVEVTGLPVT